MGEMVVIRWFEDSPDVGLPECVCSVCGEVIGEGEVPVRMWSEDKKREARFHYSCFEGVAAPQPPTPPPFMGRGEERCKVSELVEMYCQTAPGWIDEKGVYPTPALVRTEGGKVEHLAMAFSAPEIVAVAFKNCRRPEVVEQIYAFDTYCRPGQGTTLDSCLVLLYLRRGEPARVGVLEYSWNGGKPVTKEVAWDNEFWNKQYERLAGDLARAFGF